MNKLPYLLVIFVLSACGTTGIGSQSEDTNYVMASSGNAGLIYRIFTGEVLFCKGTKKGMDDVKLYINFSDGVCVVSTTRKNTNSITGVDLQ